MFVKLRHMRQSGVVDRGKVGNVYFVPHNAPYLSHSFSVYRHTFFNYSAMVRTYKRKTEQHSWSLEAMKKAVLCYVSGEMGFKKAAQEHNVPQTTLERYVLKYRANPDETIITKKLGHYVTVFTNEQETELVEYIKLMEARFYGLTSMELRTLAFELAEKNNIDHSFNKTHKIAGADWLRGFLKRHPDITYRKPEATSAARAMGFNRVAVDNFFSLLEQAIDKYKITPQRTYNVDETGVSTVPKSHSKILALSGKRQVGTLTSAERGKLMTTIVCFSAAGSYMPPMFIFPRKRMKPELLDGAPVGSWGECHESGWIQGHLFILWLKRFIEWSHASKEDPVLLLLDGHATHVKSIEVIDLARENGVVLLCFPPHCTHRLQPLDVGFMKPLSTYYSNEVKKWLRAHPGRVVTQFQTASLFGKAFIAAATMTTAVNSFRSTGIWPLEPNIFTDADFAPAETTNNPENPMAAMQSEQTTPEPALRPNSPQSGCSAINNSKERDNQRTPEPALRPSSPQPGCSGINNTMPKRSAFGVSPEAILPLPKEVRTSQRVTKRRGKTAIITESPYKKELVEQQTTKGKKACKRDITKSSEGESDKITTKKIKKCKATSRQIENASSDDDEDAECLYCGYLWSQSNEGWIRCRKCSRWAHCSCAGEDDEDDEAMHLCVMCT